MISIVLKYETVGYSINPKSTGSKLLENYKIYDNFAFNLKCVCSNLETLQADRSVLDFSGM